jgi:putative membrane protein
MGRARGPALAKFLAANVLVGGREMHTTRGVRDRTVALVACIALGTVAVFAVDVAKGESPDHHFVMEAAKGGMLEVQLGQIAADRGASDEVKRFGARMVVDHGKANDELEGLAASKGIVLPTELDAEHKAMVDEMSKLSGAELDRHYMAMMVEDHDKDVAAFEKEAKSGKDPEVKAWASATLPTLREHQRMAKDIAAKIGHRGMGHGSH